MDRFGGNNDFSTLSFSGPYVFSEKDTDTGIMTLKRNPGYQAREDIYFLDQIRFAFGETQKEVKKRLSPDVWMGDGVVAGSAYLEQKYTRPVVYGLYLNAERIPLSLRKGIIHDAILPLEYSQTGLVPRDNIFLGEVQNGPVESVDVSFFQAAFSLGYTFGGTAPLPTTPVAPGPEYATLKYITQPGTVSPLFLSSE